METKEKTEMDEKTTCQLENPISKEVPAENVKVHLTYEQKLQFEEQIRMFVQLLIQTYLLSFEIPDLHFVNASSKRMLEELKEIASQENAAFHAHNLDGALTIIDSFKKVKIRIRKTYHKSRRPHPGLPHFEIKKTISHSKVFMYPELLPAGGFSLFKYSKKFFVPAEDNLIALGLEKFSSSLKPATDIHVNLMPCKTIKQISVRIKNSKSKGSPDHPIKYYFEHKKAPSFQRTAKTFNPNDVKAPIDHPSNLLPNWVISCRTPRNPKRKALCETDTVNKLFTRKILPRSGLSKVEQKDKSEINTLVTPKMKTKSQKFRKLLPRDDGMLPSLPVVDTSPVQICLSENIGTFLKVPNSQPSIVLPSYLISCNNYYNTIPFNQLAENHLYCNNTNGDLENIVNLNFIKNTEISNVNANEKLNETTVQGTHRPIIGKVTESDSELNSEICNITIKSEIIDDSEEDTQNTCISPVSDDKPNSFTENNSFFPIKQESIDNDRTRTSECDHNFNKNNYNIPIKLEAPDNNIKSINICNPSYTMNNEIVRTNSVIKSNALQAAQYKKSTFRRKKKCN